MSSAKILKTTAELAARRFVSPARLTELARVAERYAVAVTPAMGDLIDLTNPSDPIARQFLPDERELMHAADESPDPIGDAAHSPVHGVVHRHSDRVLLKLTGLCAVYCRFCFRREMVGPMHGRSLDAGELAAALAYVRADPGIWEVILTGGDPLVLSPRRLGEVTAALGTIDHVRVLRWHTRLPVVAPESITPELVEALRCRHKAVYIGLHANHPRELTDAARVAIARLVDAGFPVLGQSVLLKGVNDDPDTLAALMRAFVEARVKPYYLHHADRAPGTAHFRTTIAEGQALMRALRERLSGLCQPTYVLDIPGGHAKVPIASAYVCPDTAEPAAYAVEDGRGHRHRYIEIER